MHTLKITYQSTDSLIAYTHHARVHSDAQIAQIAASITEFGWTNPVLLDGANGILAGHGRVLAAQHLGILQVPCIQFTHLNEDQKRAYIIADNQLAANARWDDDLLKLELGHLADAGFDLDLTGFAKLDINRLLGLDAKGGLVDEDALPQVSEKTLCQAGQIWQLGDHRLMCGDSTSLLDMNKLMAGQASQLIITDPPYNVAYEGGTPQKLTIANDQMSQSSFERFISNAYRAMYAVAGDGAPIYVFHSDTQGVIFRQAMVAAGFKLAQCCVWVKQSLVLGRSDYHWQHEPILYGWKSTGAHHWYGDRKQSTVWQFDRPARNDVHPTMKPVELISYPLENSSRVGDIVLDPFGGSGSTLIACEKGDRIARIMEIDPRYCDVIIARWQDFTGLRATLESDGGNRDDESGKGDSQNQNQNQNPNQTQSQAHQELANTARRVL